MFTYLWLACRFLRGAFVSRQHLLLENLALRQRRLPRLHPSDRLLWSWLSRIWSGWRSALVVAQPDMVIRWQSTSLWGARDLNRMLLSALRRVERRTRLRAAWTSGDTTERFFDYVPKGSRRTQ